MKCKEASWQPRIDVVAPVRERGLKLNLHLQKIHQVSRSREGAWIEILNDVEVSKTDSSRSREGAWIEILVRPCGHRYNKSLP